MISRTYEMISRTYERISRTYEMISRTYEMISRTYGEEGQHGRLDKCCEILLHSGSVYINHVRCRCSLVSRLFNHGSMWTNMTTEPTLTSKSQAHKQPPLAKKRNVLQYEDYYLVRTT